MMRDVDTGKVVVNRAMSLDGFIAGPGHAMDWIFECLPRGLVDEILVYVLPVLLGDGVRFSPPSLDRIDLEPFSNTRSGAVTTLRFRVRKQAQRRRHRPAGRRSRAAER